MIPLTKIELFSQTRTVTPALSKRISHNVRHDAGQISKKHRDTNTFDDDAYSDIKSLAAAISDIAASKSALAAEYDAVGAAIAVLHGETLDDAPSHELVKSAYLLVAKSAALNSVDSTLSVTDHRDEIEELEALKSELAEDLATASERAPKAVAAAKQAIGLAMCRTREVGAALEHLDKGASDGWESAFPEHWGIKRIDTYFPACYGFAKDATNQCGPGGDDRRATQLVNHCREQAQGDNRARRNKSVAATQRAADSTVSELRGLLNG